MARVSNTASLDDVCPTGDKAGAVYRAPILAGQLGAICIYVSTRESFRRPHRRRTLPLCHVCDTPFITEKAIDSLCSDTFMGDYRVRQQQQQACAQWARSELPDDFREPLKSDIPTLIITGTFDPVTPPSTAMKIAETLPNGFVVSIPTMSHSVGGLSNSWCFHKMVIDFLNDPSRKPDTSCVAGMLPGPYRVN